MVLMCQTTVSEVAEASLYNCLITSWDRVQIIGPIRMQFVGVDRYRLHSCGLPVGNNQTCKSLALRNSRLDIKIESFEH